MITEDFVSFETAKLLKEKGFDSSCEHQYINCSSGYPFLTDIRNDAGCYYKNSEIGEDEYSAPTLQMARKWLIENYNIHIEVRYFPMPNIYRYVIIHSPATFENIDSHPQYFNTYEGACEAAIRYCLELLI